jgi:hypothetical protein
MLAVLMMILVTAPSRPNRPQPAARDNIVQVRLYSDLWQKFRVIPRELWRTLANFGEF